MIKYAYRLEELNKTLDEVESLKIYSDFYGLSSKDLGLYALVNNEIAGAIWSRKLNATHNSTAFIDENTPVMSMAVVPKFRNQGIGTFMMEQFLQEASAVYNSLSLNTLRESRAKNFYEKFGFKAVENSQTQSIVDGADIFIMTKKLEQKELVRPSDGYDPSRWMD